MTQGDFFLSVTSESSTFEHYADDEAEKTHLFITQMEPAF